MSTTIPTTIYNTSAADTPNYTNGFDINAVLSSLIKRIGWRQLPATGGPTLNTANLTSSSGRYFQSFHSLITLTNLKSICEQPNISDADFNIYLSNLQSDAALRLLNEVFREPELIEQKLMYTRWGTQDQPVNNSSLFVYWTINIANSFGISTGINSATLYFDADCAFNLYLFMDGIKAPIKTIPVTCTAYSRTVVDFSNLILPYKIGAKYYFGYFQSELGTARAVREQVNQWATTRCFEAFISTAPATDGNTDFNHNYQQYGMLPLGLNLEIISFKDHTQKILRKANLFDEGIGLTVASMVIEEIVMSTRTNLEQRQTAEQANKLFTDLNQAFATDTLPIMPGIKSRLASEVKRLRSTFFPEAQPMSISQEQNAYGADQSWAKQNYQVLTNPSFQVQ